MLELLKAALRLLSGIFAHVCGELLSTRRSAHLLEAGRYARLAEADDASAAREAFWDNPDAMGHRLSKIYTRTGDAGTTGLGDGSRTGKDSLRIAAIGDVDETNSLLGVLLCEALDDEVRELLTGIQHDLFDLGGELAVPGSTFLKEAQPARLETAIDRYNAELQPLKEFILPGGTRAAALAHLARAVCRRAERSVVALAAAEPVSDAARQYLNRLSDLLFVLPRWLNKQAGCGDVLWQKGKNG